MKAIIVAAGRGRRLGPETAGLPKCMVAVGGRPILHRQLDALRTAGVDDVVVVRGYLGDRIAAPGAVRFVENPDWPANNVLASLLCAEAEMDGGFLFSYSDIVFAPDVAARLARATGDVTLVIDRRWAEAYEGRSLHPVSEAELARVGPHPAGTSVLAVGKRAVPPEQAAGEFIGLARFSAAGAAALRGSWRTARERGLDRPFGDAPALRQAYLTDALNDLAGAGARLAPLFIDGGWREIDTEQDLARAHAAVAAF